jgi:hypothetical protein
MAALFCYFPFPTFCFDFGATAPAGAFGALPRRPGLVGAVRINS